MQTIFFKSNGQKGNFWPNNLMVLFLLSAFSLDLGCPGNKSLAELFKNTSMADLPKKIARTDVSKLVNGVDYLHAGVDDGRYELVCLILAKLNRDKASGVNYKNDFPNLIDKKNRKTPLGKAIAYCAIENGKQQNYRKIVQVLINNDYVDPNFVCDNQEYPLTSLLLALQNKDPITAQILIDYGRKRINLTSPDPQSGATPLHTAIENRYFDLKESLLKELFLTPNVLYLKDRWQRTPLHLAIEFGDNRLAEFLINNAYKSYTPLINLCGKDKDDNTPLHLAIKFKHENLAKHLITTVQKLSRNSFTFSLDYLSISNKEGKTPQDLAIENNMQAIVALLTKPAQRPSIHRVS